MITRAQRSVRHPDWQEIAPADEMRAMQLAGLQKQLEYVAARSRFYRRAFSRAGVAPQDIRTLDDLRRLPLTSKDDLRAHGRDFVCAQPRQIRDYVATTGSTGPPILMPATQRDWDSLLRSALRRTRQVGIGPRDVVQLTVAFDQLFTVGIPYDSACKRLGAGTVRMGPGNTARQVEMLQRTGATWLVCGSHYMLALASEAQARNLDPRRDFALRGAIVFAQAVRGPGWLPNALHHKLDAAWGVPLYSDYGSIELYGGFVDCLHFGGHHTHWDRHLFELLDPKTLEPVPEGEVGELVFTHLTAQGTPLVRFRQGDLARIETQPCPCGRTAPRIMEIMGRTDEMLKIKDTAIYPRQVEEAVLEVPGVEAFVIEVDLDEKHRERMLIRVAVNGGYKEAALQISARVKARTRVTPIVVPTPQHEILALQTALGTRKAKTFWDRRNPDRPTP